MSESESAFQGKPCLFPVHHQMIMIMTMVVNHDDHDDEEEEYVELKRAL